MANRNFLSQKLFSGHAMMVEIDCNFVAGASGAVTAGSVKGPYVKSITRLAAGIYQIRLQDNYSKLYAALGSILQGPIPGSAVTAGSFVSGTAYQIVTLGTTDYSLIGVPVGITPAVGTTFVATGVGSGTGTAKAVTNSGIEKIEVIGSSLQSTDKSNNNGAMIIIQCLGATDASTTTLIPKDPASGSIVGVAMLLSNSSVLVQGE